MAYSWRLLNSLGCLPTAFRDTFFATGRAQAANNAGLRFGTGLIVLPLATCDHASRSNGLACRRPRCGYTRDGARSARRPALRHKVFGAVLRLPHPNLWE